MPAAVARRDALALGAAALAAPALAQGVAGSAAVPGPAKAAGSVAPGSTAAAGPVAPGSTAAAGPVGPGSTTAAGFLAEGGFDRAAFDAWTAARTGTGKPVFWYSEGTVRALYSGELLAFMEGYDTARAFKPDPAKPLVHQYNRKHYIYRDATTGDIIRARGGVTLAPTAYPYQFITYELVGDRVHTMVEQGTAPRVQKIGPGTNMACRELGGAYVFTAPVYLDFPAGPNRRYQAFENYDFVVRRNAPPSSYALSWLRTGDAPAGLGGKPCVMHLVTRRFERFEDVPAGFRRYIETEAPLWREPPKDLAEVRRLQAGGAAGASFGA